MVGVGRGGMDASFKLTRQEIAAAYDAGRDADCRDNILTHRPVHLVLDHGQRCW